MLKNCRITILSCPWHLNEPRTQIVPIIDAVFIYCARFIDGTLVQWFNVCKYVVYKTATFRSLFFFFYSFHVDHRL